MRTLARAVGGVMLLGAALAAAPAEAVDIGATPSYSGDLLSRSTLTGDWGGARNDLAAKGLTFEASVTQVEQGVVDGGKNGTWEYGGRGDLTGTLDTQKMGLWPGGFLSAELEGNWSDSVSGKTGSLSPVNSNQLYPLPTGTNVALPQLVFAQFLSHYFGGLVGKLQTVSDGDDNEFAHGKGDTQFLNLALNVNPTLLVVPYSTLGAGAIVLPTADPNEAVLKLLVVSATGKPSTDGFDNLNGAMFLGEGRMRTDFFGLTGHQLLGGVYSNKQYTSLDARIEFEPLRGGLTHTIAKHDDTWVAYYNFDQFLYETDKSAGKGVGLFGRFGADEGAPNPMQYFYSIGVGGKGLVPSRDLDRFGIGYFYTSVNNPTLTVPVIGTKSFLRDEWGFEAFYNVALTPWLLLTPDVQVVGPSQKRRLTGNTITLERVETATVLGVRLQLLL